MSKFEEVIETLKSAEKNKEQLNAITSTLQRVISEQRKSIESLEKLLSEIESGNVTPAKKRGGYRGRRKKEEGQG
jgi:signal transduction histidine kinase